MKSSKPDLTYSVLESKAAFDMATRYLEIEMAQPDQDAWILGSVPQRRGLLNKFQKLVMDIFCDDLFMETILETPESQLETEVGEVYAIYKEFITKFPHYEVIAIVPMTLTGTVGFITEFRPPRT